MIKDVYLIIMQYNKINFKQRRLHSSNFYSFGKSSCRVAATPRTLGSSSFPFYHNQVPFCSNSTKPIIETVKIHFRTFKSSKHRWIFKKKLQVRFNKFSKKKLKMFRNYRGNKIRYFCINENKIKASFINKLLGTFK